MTLEDLRAFVATYRAGSMSAAARTLRCTQGAVAQHVRRLERELGCELFARQRRGVASTADGDRLFEVASRSLDDLDSLVGEIGHASRVQGERLRLATSALFASRHLRKPLLELRSRRPSVEIDIEPADTTDERVRALRERRADLALIPADRPLQSLETRAYSSVVLALQVAVDHPLAECEALEPNDLRFVHYIAQSASSGTCLHVQEQLRRHGICLVPSQVVEDPVAAAVMTELGQGVTFVEARRASAIEKAYRVRVLPLPWLEPVPICWVARNFALLPEATTEFIEICASYA